MQSTLSSFQALRICLIHTSLIFLPNIKFCISINNRVQGLGNSVRHRWSHSSANKLLMLKNRVPWEASKTNLLITLIFPMQGSHTTLNETQSVITQADSILHLRNTILMMKMKLKIVIGRGGKSKSNQSKVCTDLPNDYFDFQSCWNQRHIPEYKQI